MQKDLVFFKKEGEEGVALTSTSANHIANMANVKWLLKSLQTSLTQNMLWLQVSIEKYSRLLCFPSRHGRMQSLKSIAS